VELKEACAAMREDAGGAAGGICAGARVDQNIPAGVCRDARGLAQVDVFRHFQETRRGVERDLRNGVLRHQRSGGERCCARKEKKTLHRRPPSDRGCRINFCTRHAVISLNKSSFSFRQSISWMVLNWPSSFPAFPNFPRIVPSSSIL